MEVSFLMPTIGRKQAVMSLSSLYLALEVSDLPYLENSELIIYDSSDTGLCTIFPEIFPSLLEHFFQLGLQVRHIRAPKIGIGATRAAMFKLMRGEIGFSFDDDILVTPSILRLKHMILVSSDFSFVVPRCTIRVDNTGVRFTDVEEVVLPRDYPKFEGVNWRLPYYKIIVEEDSEYKGVPIDFGVAPIDMAGTQAYWFRRSAVPDFVIDKLSSWEGNREDIFITKHLKKGALDTTAEVFHFQTVDTRIHWNDKDEDVAYKVSLQDNMHEYYTKED